MEISPTRWSQINEIFEQALALPVEERAAYLAEACGMDEELRAEIESLLAAHEAAGDNFLGEGDLSRKAAALVTNQLPDLSGQSIKHFVLLKRLGIGGMGEVYLADDKLLRRQVALKLLPVPTAMEDERLQRFAREARTASSLNHPNIMTVFEFGHDEGRHFIVTEYVEGQTLRERLGQGAFTLEETLAIAEQVLAALEVAHRAGIIHRDIKPENLMLRSDGVVKVLDFGIAKLLPRLREEDAVRRAAVTSFMSTEKGIALGTPGYMSPEQVRGQEVTARSDLFSLGVVLFELLAGQLPFQGDTKADINAQVLKTKPFELTKFRPDLPVAYEAVMNRLLVKDPEARWASASELRVALAQLPRRPLSNRQILLRRAKRPVAAGALVLICLCLIGLGIVKWRRNQLENKAQAAWGNIANLNINNIYTNRLGFEISDPAFAPDGQSIVFEMRNKDKAHIYLLPREGGTPQQLTFGEAVDMAPLWSPNGRTIAFISNRAGLGEWGVWRAPRTGGQPELWFKLPVQGVKLIAWREDGLGERLYYEQNQNLHVFQVAQRQTEQLTFLPLIQGRSSFRLSPEGQRLTYVEWKDQVSHLTLLDLRNQRVDIVHTTSKSLYAPKWLPDGGNLVFISAIAGNLQPHLYSLSTRQAIPLQVGSDDYSDLAVAPDGRTILGRLKSENANIYEIDLEGQESGLTTEKGLHQLPIVSPDGKRLLYHSMSGFLNSSSVKLLEGSLANLDGKSTIRTERVLGAIWSPDGNWVAYSKPKLTQRALYLQKTAGNEERLVTDQLVFYRLQTLPFNLISQDFSFSPDSRRLIYVSKEGNQHQLKQFDTKTAESQPLSPLGPVKSAFLSPVCSPSGDRVALIQQDPRNPPNQKTLIYRVGIVEKNQYKELHHGESALRMLGWLSNNEFLVAAGGPAFGKLQDASLLKCDALGQRCEPIGSLPEIYLPSLALSPDKSRIAFVGQYRRSLNMGLYQLNSSRIQWLSSNSDPSFFYGGVSWGPDSKRLYYSKQHSFEILRTIELR